MPRKATSSVKSASAQAPKAVAHAAGLAQLQARAKQVAAVTASVKKQ